MKKNKRQRSLSNKSLPFKYLLWVKFSIIALCVFSLPSFAGNEAGDRKSSPPIALPISGKVTDETGKPLVGANIEEKGTNNKTVTKSDGSFFIMVANENAVLLISYVGYLTKEIKVAAQQNNIQVELVPNAEAMNNVVVVGYGRQKKESVVGAISQTTGAVLQRAGGVSSIGAALTGNVPGIITVQGTGLPGAEDPTIY